MGHFYRFRRCSALLGEWKELDTQTIFFAEPNSLNDPMEGYRDILWKGDFVVWMNLFKNYLFCLERVFCLYRIGGDDFEIKDENIPVFSGVDDISTLSYKKRFLKISDAFISHKVVIRMANELAKRKYPVRRDELIFHLTYLQFIALNIIDEINDGFGLGRLFDSAAFDSFSAAEQAIIKLLDEGLITNVDYVVEHNEGGAEIIDALMKKRYAMQMEMGLLRKVDGSLKNASHNKDMIFLDFNRRYLSQLEHLLFPKWYTACFMTECKDSAVWGHYGDNHAGVCLIFESEERNGFDNICLYHANGLGGDGEIYEFSPCQFHPVDYISGVVAVDFFSMLGRLPIPKLNAEWYTFKKERSVCSREMNADAAAWRERYWSSFINDITRKTHHWAYENEYRVIIFDGLIDYSSPKKRALKYNFSSLKGVIFGMNTKAEDRVSIVQIIKDKCKENNINDFKFYQAYYDPKTKCIEHGSLGLLDDFVQADRI